MSYLMHIAFDNPFRLETRITYFRYAGIKFKLIQNDPREWSDVLLTLTEASSGPEVQAALEAAGEWASALCWEYDVGLTVRHIGGPGKPKTFRLRAARCQMRVFPELPFHGAHRGYSIARIANITTSEQRTALTLYREAQSANKVWLAFLLNWQILEVGNGNAIGFANRIAKKHATALGLAQSDIRELGIAPNRLGEHLEDDFRHAIAHIRRRPGKQRLRFDNDEEAARIFRGARIVRELAKIYIRDELKLNSRRYLVRRHASGFPSYEDTTAIATGFFRSVR